MKKIIIILFSLAILFSLTQCNNPTSDKLCEKADTRGKIISTLLSNEAYMNEVMDSMRAKHADVLLSNISIMAESDMKIQQSMMDDMMGMCKNDSSMCKMMMNKTMAMCDADQSKCKMMMGSMQSSPGMIKSMHSMCEVDNMKGQSEEKIKEHQHH